MAYYTKTSQEMTSSSWIVGPQDLDRMFSPAFLFNQRADQDLQRMSIEEGIRTIIEHGCATWATMPYDEDDGAGQPSAQAVTEASGYKALDLRRVGAYRQLLPSDLYDMENWLANDGIWSRELSLPAETSRGTCTVEVVAYDVNGDAVLLETDEGKLQPLKSVGEFKIQ